ncbi:peptide deformylase [Serratia sp. 1D1416]|uniref:peptide deformylase n=1 Tax=Serratia sp. 1D1416 TaxID=2447890 RepID=UPI001013C9B3|nr:peptide deformylase [Serratia sp. 1D1416]
MTPSHYVPTNHPVLRTVASPIPVEEIANRTIQDYVKAMLDIGKQEPGMAGLAAPQIGISLPIVIINSKSMQSQRPIPDGTNPDSFDVYINPEILTSSGESELDSEGCFSVPGMVGVVPRAKNVTVRARDQTGKEVLLELSGFSARVFQHEIDHINGILYPDVIFRHNPHAKGLHLLSHAYDPVEYQQKRFHDYREAIGTWRKEHGNIDNFTWKDTIGKITWENEISHSRPVWKK